MVSNNASVPAKEAPIAKELEKDEVEVREKTRLEFLQQEQKLIEERNKRKKALLTKTIAEKSKQTQAETVKLKRIQKEVQALDDMVSNDIGILRGRIEQASWDYNVARKRYEKAEAEYVTAKLDLHKKTDIKEQLTEHLFAIIQQNELRKALKLEELLQQLQLQATEEELERKREEEEEKEKERKRVIALNGEEVKADQAASEEDTTSGLAAKTHGLGGTVVNKDGLTLTEPKTSDQDCKILDESSQQLGDAGSSPCTS
ncbi:RAB6-interacting golgin [Aplochiton taeniatus]